ncbi:DUF6318 family protein [Actinomyces ruminicola]|uniref:DUF6318 family protein n=1 Tax=Actinomyces ruminicola TaxID=332524 RepID=UPI0011C944E2|nr:DUF6318 family protein [Actinomyces ruminicola]
MPASTPAAPERRLSAAATCLAALALAAGCATTSNTTTVPSAPLSATSTSTVSATPTPTLPPEQAEARATALAMEPPQPSAPEFTPDGAAEAVAYFLELYPYVYATGDLDAWKSMSEDDCIFCNSVMNNATELHDSGGWADPWEQEIMPLEWWTDQEDLNRYVVRSQIHSPERDQYSGANEPPLHIDEAYDVVRVQLYWEGHDWIIEALEVEDGDDS